METEFKDKLVTMYYLASVFFNKMENEQYKLVLPNNLYKPANIFETIILGIAHLKIRIEGILGKSLHEELFCTHLLRYAEGYFKKNDLHVIANTDYDTVLSEGLKGYKNFLVDFCYSNPDRLVPADEYRKLYLYPLQFPIPHRNHDLPEPLPKYLPLISTYIKAIDAVLEPLKEILQKEFTT